ncbi:MAG TPA: hypothetical protein VHN15_05785, partial [Thermoanaerobaculia bacterium]|nr:hypothetical protein [Thermoanaerobaculia bacterium]
MWSDRLPAPKRQEIEERLRAVLPPPRPRAAGTTTPLPDTPPPGQVAEVLRRRPGFAWLDAGSGGASGQHRLFSRPLVTLQVRNRRARVKGPLGSAAFSVRGFDLLEAALAAWAPAAAQAGQRALLVGYLGYELGRDLEKVPPPPEDDLGLPDLHLALYDQSLLWDGRSWSLESTDAWPAASSSRQA